MAIWYVLGWTDLIGSVVNMACAGGLVSGRLYSLR